MSFINSCFFIEKILKQKIELRDLTNGVMKIVENYNKNEFLIKQSVFDMPTRESLSQDIRYIKVYSPDTTGKAINCIEYDKNNEVNYRCTYAYDKNEPNFSCNNSLIIPKNKELEI